MNRDEFEKSVIELWMSSRIALTPAHIQVHTGVARRKVNRWLAGMVDDGALTQAKTKSGAVLYRVPDAVRPADGPTSFAELERKQAIRAAARAKVRRARGLDDDGEDAPAKKRRHKPEAEPRKRAIRCSIWAKKPLRWPATSR